MTRHLLPIAIVALAFSAPAQSQTPGIEIGVAEWINPSTTGLPPSASVPRELSHGARMIEHEEVTTHTAGVADFLFYNRSRLLIGPGCEVVLDNRYYDRELDLEVKEFSLRTKFRCIMKADNILATGPDGQIVIRTAAGDIEIRGASTVIGLDGPESQGQGLDGPIQEKDLIQPRYRLTVLGNDLKRGGSVAVEGSTIRRSGFVIRVYASGAVRGPERATPDLVNWLQSGLEGVVPAADRPGWTGDYILGKIDPVAKFPDRLIPAPTNCIQDDCEFRARLDGQVIIRQFDEDDDVIILSPGQ